MKTVVLFRVLAVTLAFFAMGGIASAVTINVSTGIGLTTAGQPDPYWTVGGGTLSSVAPAQLLTPNAPNWFGIGVYTGWATAWVANDSNSQWIGVTAANVSNGSFYTYFRTFNLTGINLSTVSLSGSWAIDDAGYLFLNGYFVASFPDGNWRPLATFSVPVGSSEFEQGSNTLTMFMSFTDDYLEGARLYGQVTGAAVPVPASMLLFGPGLLGLIGIRRRLKK